MAKNKKDVSVLKQNNTSVHQERHLSSRRQIPAPFLGLMVNERKDSLDLGQQRCVVNTAVASLY